MKKIFGVIFAVFFLALSTNSSFAQNLTPPPNQSLPLNIEQNVPQNLSTYSQVVFIELMSAISCQLSGINPINPEGKCLGASGNDGKIGFVESGGALGFMNRGIAATYDFPASGSQYIAHVASNFGLTKTANAQFGTGDGFRGLTPFLPIWEAFRNIMYLFFVLIFVVIGVGIMFRVKIDPRSVMTIQNAIPKIIIGLVFITLSYAIVGFMIDLMRISTYFIYGIMASIPGADVGGLKPSDIQGANPFTAANQLAGGTNAGGIAGIATHVTGTVVGSIKDAIGLGPGGGPSIPGLPEIKGIGDIFGSIIKHIPGLSELGSLLSKIPLIGGLIGGLGNIAKGTVGSFANQSFVNYLIHAASIGAGFVAGIQVGTLVSNTPGGGFSIQGSFLGIGGGGGFQVIPGFLMGWPAGTIAGGAVAALTETLLRELLPNLIAFFIILIAIFTAMFRLWFQLIKAYIYLFLFLIFAPFFIAFGILPGVQMGVGSWFRSVVANLAVFPATYMMLLLGKVLIDSVGQSNGNVFIPPLVGDFSNSMAGFAAILGMGILLLTPEVANIVKETLKAQDFKFASSIGRALGTGQGALGKPISGIKHELFGKDALGAPKEGSLWAQRKFAGIGRALTGGGIKQTHTNEGLSMRGMSEKEKSEHKVGWLPSIFGGKKKSTIASATRPGGTSGATSPSIEGETLAEKTKREVMERSRARMAGGEADGSEIGRSGETEPEHPAADSPAPEAPQPDTAPDEPEKPEGSA